MGHPAHLMMAVGCVIIGPAAIITRSSQGIGEATGRRFRSGRRAGHPHIQRGKRVFKRRHRAAAEKGAGARCLRRRASAGAGLAEEVVQHLEIACEPWHPAAPVGSLSSHWLRCARKERTHGPHDL